MIRNIVFAIIFVGMLTACSQGADFSKPGVVINKTLLGDKSAYHLSQDNNGVRGKGFGSIIFHASNEFANVGDTILCKDGVIMVVVDKGFISNLNEN